VVNTIFNNYEHQSAGTLLLGAFSYAFQLYADFSGYSDMAIGIGKLMGFRLMNNFSYPFFALNISQFWRKWHISLTSWLTDYVYTPLSIRLRDWDKTGLAISIITTFTLVGMWHGAKWNWIWFGVLHSLMFIPLILKGNAFKGGLAVSKGRLWPTLPDAFRMLGTFCIVMLLFVVFRADTLGQAIDYIRRLFSFSLFSGALPFSRKELVYLGLIVIMMAVEWVQREKQHGLVLDRVGRPFVRLVIYYAIIGAILLFGNFSASSFIYFKF
jgi:D-alanyl-lipoteichoic acid acyltransferase DltB (MBOAT superfamily)